MEDCKEDGVEVEDSTADIDEDGAGLEYSVEDVEEGIGLLDRIGLGAVEERISEGGTEDVGHLSETMDVGVTKLFGSKVSL